MTKYSRARRDEPPGSDHGGDTERPGDEPLRRVRESAATHDVSTRRGWGWHVNEESIDSSSFLGFSSIRSQLLLVRSFVYIFLSLSNATHERHVILHSLHRFVSLFLSL